MSKFKYLVTRLFEKADLLPTAQDVYIKRYSFKGLDEIETSILSKALDGSIDDYLYLFAYQGLKTFLEEDINSYQDFEERIIPLFDEEEENWETLCHWMASNCHRLAEAEKVLEEYDKDLPIQQSMNIAYKREQFDVVSALAHLIHKECYGLIIPDEDTKEEPQTTLIESFLDKLSFA